MHMPGHKRNPAFAMDNPYAIDVTEVEGTDNLHHPEGVILALMEQMKKLYGTVKSWPLVGGSTCGILTAVSACCKKGSVVLMDRGCHRSVYHACYLLGLRPEYLMPSVDENSGIAVGIPVDEVRRGLARARESGQKISAVILTSPTYEGVLSDIRKIAEIVHREDIPMIVDEAHGAHLPFWVDDILCIPPVLSDHMDEKEPADVDWQPASLPAAGRDRYPSAVICGADLVIQSLHKTLPALTQTAVLHLCSDRVAEPLIDRYLDIYETSSPSYVLMSGIAQCMDFMEMNAGEAMAAYQKNLQWFETQAENWKMLNLWSYPSKEPSKLVIRTGKSGLSGPELAHILRREYKIEVEMEASDYILAMTSLADGRENFERLASALSEIDRELVGKTDIEKSAGRAQAKPGTSEGKKNAGKIRENTRIAQAELRTPERMKNKGKTEEDIAENKPTFLTPVVRLDAYEAMNRQTEDLFYRFCAGRIAASYVMVYPPGIPFVVPGEEITDDIIDRIEDAKKKKLRLLGLCGSGEDKLQVCLEIDGTGKD